MLDIQNLKVGLDTDSGVVRALDGLSLAIERGETFALVGESGCGKSMTALALLRLLPENGAVTGGRVMLDGKTDLVELPELAMRLIRGRRIAMIFQEPATSLNPVMRVGDQLVEAIEAHTALRGQAARAKAIQWMGRVGIPEPERRIDEYPFRLSGGQKQRIMIAMALATEPDFLVADEPTTALDVTIQAQILDLLKTLQKEQGMGMLLITHDLAVVSGMAHRVALMYAGQIIEVAGADEFFAAPKHPYANALLRALPDAQKRGGSLAAIGGTVPPLWQEFNACRFAPRCERAFATCHAQVPELLDLPAFPKPRSVRCWLHVPGIKLPMDASDMARADGIQSQPEPLPPVRSDDHGSLLEVRGLTVSFTIGKRFLSTRRKVFKAVDKVSFDIRAGETLALVGESGCGKTTTGKAIVQLLRNQASIEGQALLDGKDLFSLSGDGLLEARRSIQIIFQDPFASLNPRMRVFDVLEEGLLALRPELDSRARRKSLEAMVDQVGLRQDALERYPHEFSGGQRQRIAIARALAVQPRLIVCDEPTSALDVSVQAQILNLLRQLQRDMGLSFLFITHNIGVVEYIADSVAVMRAGCIVEAGRSESVLQHPQHDYTKTLLAAVPRLRVAERAA